MKHRENVYPKRLLHLSEAIEIYDKVIRVGSRTFNYYTLAASNLTNKSHYNIYDTRKEHFHRLHIDGREEREETPTTIFHRRPAPIIAAENDFIVESLQMAKKSWLSGDLGSRNRYVDFFTGTWEIRAPTQKEIDRIRQSIEKILE